MLDVKYENGRPVYRWSNCIKGFNMPLKIYDQRGKSYMIHPTQKFKQSPKGVKNIKIDINYYVKLNIIT